MAENGKRLRHSTSYTTSHVLHPEEVRCHPDGTEEDTEELKSAKRVL